MIECLILGDSIGVGLSKYKPECYNYSHGGYNTYQWNKRYVGGLTSFKGIDTVIISLGSNDHKYVKTEKELIKLRDSIVAKNVYWILPAGNLKSPSNLPISEIQSIISKVASINNDLVITIKELQKDGIHPNSGGYKQIVKDVK